MFFVQECLEIFAGPLQGRNASLNRSFFSTVTKYHICGAVIIAEGTGSEVNPRVDRSLALVVLALPRVCLLPSFLFSQALFHHHCDLAHFVSDSKYYTIKKLVGIRAIC